MKPIAYKNLFRGFADTRQGGRRENQDSCAWCESPHGLLITVCDGMGGGPAGKLASSLAVNSIAEYIKNTKDTSDKCKLVENAILYANHCILDYAEEDPDLRGMGTTATVLLINEQSAAVAHVGDSRIYQLRRGKKVFRTWDHSLVFKKIEDKIYKNEEEARTAAESNVILQSLGRSELRQVDVKELPYEKHDRFLLCTDGIWGAFPEEDIIKMASAKELSGAMDSLIVRVDSEGFKSGGLHDNLTAAILETRKESLLKDTMSTKQKTMVTILAVLCTLSIIANILLLFGRKPDSGLNNGAVQQQQDSTVIQQEHNPNNE